MYPGSARRVDATPSSRSCPNKKAAWAPLLLCGADSVRGQYKKNARRGGAL